MEKLKNKHDHALTQWLKVIIFAILMMAPFFSVLSRCLYVTCNKNAKDSYTDSMLDRQVLINDNYTYLDNQIYYVQFDSFQNGNNVSLQGKFNIDFNSYNNQILNDRVQAVVLNLSNGTMYLSTYNSSTDSFDYYNTLSNVWGNTLKSFSFEFIKYKTTSYITFPYTSITNNAIKLYQLTYVKETLDNAFEYSVNQLTQSQTFNWVTNTAIYQPVNAMTTGLGFDANNNIVALLLTYWAILTAVYVLFDIIISCFVKLTHLVSGNS